MTQIGCFIPAESAAFPPFTALYTRIGASDNQSRGVSTFMNEMIDMSNILNACAENDSHANSLIVIDELGRGTST
jgi:DNA mismatch repair ATPase MutS